MKPDNDNFNSNQEYIHHLEAQIKSLKSFIDNSEAGMYVSDYHTGEILYANRKTIAMFGNQLSSADEMIGKICWELLTPGSKERCAFCRNKELLGSNGELLDAHTWEHYFTKYGIWLKIISQAIVWPDGRLAQMNTYYDITETKKLQEEMAAHAREKEYRRMQQAMQDVLDALPIPVRITELDTGNFVYVNNACVKMFDYKSPEDMLRLNIANTIPLLQSDGTSSKEKIKKILSINKTEDVEIEYLTSKGKIIDSRITISPFEYEGRMCVLGTIQDLAAERQQRKMLQNAAEKEREANKLKSSFLSNMSHEIRTPMNAIIGLTEIELRKKHTKDSLEVYRKINISAKSLLQIVNDILDLSKIEADKLDFYSDEFELEDVLNNALMVVSPRLEGKRVELLLDISPDLPDCFESDKTRLWQVLKNYLDNAAKFTEEGYIILSVAKDKAKSTDDTIYVSFTVKDTGIGMNKEQLQKAFLPYEQIYNESQMRYTGTGLGLPLSTRICELMGGTVEVESYPEIGTTICFTLPFTRLKTADPGAKLARIPNLTGKKVLIADDSEFSLKIIGALLKCCNADYMVVQSGMEVSMLIDCHPHFDIVLLDYVLGNENGIKIAKKMRKKLPKSAKILLVTAYGSSIERDELEKNGIDDIIEKPFTPSLFYNRINEIIGIKQKKEEAKAYAKFVNANVLVCEDNEINQAVAEGMLAQFGVTCVFAGNGKIGLEILSKNDRFDLILMDIHMPVMDGYEAAEKIRKESKYNHIPIISLTADAMTEVLDKCLASGMNGYLPKPFVMDDFHEMLLRWLPNDKCVYAKKKIRL